MSWRGRKGQKRARRFGTSKGMTRSSTITAKAERGVLRLSMAIRRTGGSTRRKTE